MVGRSRGAIALARIGLSQGAIAARVRRAGVSCSRAAVGHWMTGHVRPNGDARTVLRVLFGIVETHWLEEGHEQQLLLLSS